MIFIQLKFLQANLRGGNGKGRHFYGQFRAALSFATPLLATYTITNKQNHKCDRLRLHWM